jgi:hypothetical protein
MAHALPGAIGQAHGMQAPLPVSLLSCLPFSDTDLIYFQLADVIIAANRPEHTSIHTKPTTSMARITHTSVLCYRCALKRDCPNQILCSGMASLLVFCYSCQIPCKTMPPSRGHITVLSRLQTYHADIDRSR